MEGVEQGGVLLGDTAFLAGGEICAHGSEVRNIPKAEHVGIDEDESIEVGEGEAPHFEVDTLAVMLALVLVLVELLKELVGDLEVYGEEGVFIGLVKGGVWMDGKDDALGMV